MESKLFFCLILLLSACGNNSNQQQSESTPDYKMINDQLTEMTAKDQAIQMAYSPTQSKEERDSIRDEQYRIFRENTEKIKQWFNDFGFLGFAQIGEEGAHNFWLLVQHSDHDLPFQEAFLKEMEAAVQQKNADAVNFAYLTDRVLSNKGEKQLYGTQLSYTNDFWVTPQPLQDSLKVDQRRIAIGLEPINEYLNFSMEMHYEMNKAVYEQNGMTGPNKYQ